MSGVVTNLKVITRAASERIARFAFEFAASNGRGLVTCAHKANVMCVCGHSSKQPPYAILTCPAVCVCRKLSDGLFLRCCEEVAKDYPSIKFEAMDMDRVVLQVPAVAVLPLLGGIDLTCWCPPTCSCPAAQSGSMCWCCRTCTAMWQVTWPLVSSVV